MPSTSQSGTSAHEPEMRAAIISAAAALFSERGYARTKVVDIARAVGITPPSLYWHFASKEDILFEYLCSRFELFDQRMQSAMSTPASPTEQLRSLAVAHTTAQLEFREQAQAVLAMTHSAAQLAADLSADRMEQIRAMTRGHIDRTRQVVRDGVASGEFTTPDVNALTFAVLNVCEYTALWFRPDGGASIAEVAAANGEFAVRMATAGERPGDPGDSGDHDDPQT